MPFCQLQYHLVWSTQYRQPLLIPSVERTIHVLLRRKATELGGVVHALNGTTDHVHMVVEIPPKIAVARFIGQVKAFASTEFNITRSRGTPAFRWQREYGAFTVNPQRLALVIRYVERQKIHHAQGDTIAILERTVGNQRWWPGDTGSV